MSRVHRIERIRFDVSTDSRESAEQVQNVLSDFQQHRLPQVLEECLHGAASANVTRVEIDVGTVALNELEEAVERQLRAQLARYLNATTAESGTGRDALQVISASDDRAALLRYLQSGIPGWRVFGAHTTLDHAVRALIREEGGLPQDVARVLATPSVLERLYAQLEDETKRIVRAQMEHGVPKGGESSVLISPAHATEPSQVESQQSASRERPSASAKSTSAMVLPAGDQLQSEATVAAATVAVNRYLNPRDIRTLLQSRQPTHGRALLHFLDWLQRDARASQSERIASWHAAAHVALVVPPSASATSLFGVFTAEIAVALERDITQYREELIQRSEYARSSAAWRADLSNTRVLGDARHSDVAVRPTYVSAAVGLVTALGTQHVAPWQRHRNLGDPFRQFRKLLQYGDALELKELGAAVKPLNLLERVCPQAWYRLKRDIANDAVMSARLSACELAGRLLIGSTRSRQLLIDLLVRGSVPASHQANPTIEWLLLPLISDSALVRILRASGHAATIAQRIERSLPSQVLPLVFEHFQPARSAVYKELLKWSRDVSVAAELHLDSRHLTRSTRWALLTCAIELSVRTEERAFSDKVLDRIAAALDREVSALRGTGGRNSTRKSLRSKDLANSTHSIRGIEGAIAETHPRNQSEQRAHETAILLQLVRLLARGPSEASRLQLKSPRVVAALSRVKSRSQTVWDSFVRAINADALARSQAQALWPEHFAVSALPPADGAITRVPSEARVSEDPLRSVARWSDGQDSLEFATYLASGTLSSHVKRLLRRSSARRVMQAIAADTSTAGAFRDALRAANAPRAISTRLCEILDERGRAMALNVLAPELAGFVRTYLSCAQEETSASSTAEAEVWMAAYYVLLVTAQDELSARRFIALASAHTASALAISEHEFLSRVRSNAWQQGPSSEPHAVLADTVEERISELAGAHASLGSQGRREEKSESKERRLSKDETPELRAVRDALIAGSPARLRALLQEYAWTTARPSTQANESHQAWCVQLVREPVARLRLASHARSEFSAQVIEAVAKTPMHLISAVVEPLAHVFAAWERATQGERDNRVIPWSRRRWCEEAYESVMMSSVESSTNWRLSTVRALHSMLMERWQRSASESAAELVLIASARRKSRSLAPLIREALSPEPVRVINRQPVEEEPIQRGEVLQVRDAGLVLLWPFFGHYFERVGLLSDGEFVGPHAAKRAVHLLRALAVDDVETREVDLTLHKVLCGVPFATPIPRSIDRTPLEITLGQELLQVALQRWSTLSGSSVDTFRAEFLQRDGRLEYGEDAWMLTVERRSFDVLLHTLPWNLTPLRMQWMPMPIHVRWRE